MLTFCNSYVLWLLRCVQLRLVTVTFCDINVVWCYVLSQYPGFFYQNFRNGEKQGFICLLRWEKCSSYCRGYFFLAAGCYISLLPLFLYYISRKLLEDSIGAPERVARKFSRWEKNSAPLVKLHFLNNLIKMRSHCLRTGPLTDLKGFCENSGLGKGI